MMSSLESLHCAETKAQAQRVIHAEIDRRIAAQIAHVDQGQGRHCRRCKKTKHYYVAYEEGGMGVQ